MIKTTQRLKKAGTGPYIGFLRRELKITNCKVKKWLDWEPEAGEYFALIDSRYVIVPIPVCDWSFLVALHEIGHVSTGYRLSSYLMEYNAERWAMRRAKESYGIVSDDYLQDAKNYVRNHLLENLTNTDLTIKRVKPYVLDWLGETKETIAVALQEIN